MTENSLLFQNVRLLTPLEVLEQGWLLVENQTITRTGSGTPPRIDGLKSEAVIDAGGFTLAPGLIDLHVHGAFGHEVMDASLESIHEIARFLARHGVTAFLAATWTAEHTRIMAALNAVYKAYGRINGGASLLGAYLEGPYLNPNRAGAQAMDLIHPAVDRAQALELLDTNMVSILVMAPEYPENIWLMDECARRSISVSAGHTAATYEQMRVAVERGVCQVTHCFNAMNPLHHRQPGVVGAAMTMPELRCELIADNVHVHPLVQRILYQLRGAQGILLVSDSTRCTGLPDGEYDLDGRKVTVKNGAVHLPDGTLAGSVLTLDQAVRNFMVNVNTSLGEALACASLYPARAAGVAHRKGSLEPGKDADMILLDANLQVKMTVVEGEIIYKS